MTTSPHNAALDGRANILSLDQKIESDLRAASALISKTLVGATTDTSHILVIEENRTYSQQP